MRSMVYRTPYVPGYALEVDCLVVATVILTLAWAKAARREGRLEGTRWLAVWWFWLSAEFVVGGFLPWFVSGTPIVPGEEIFGFAGRGVALAVSWLAWWETKSGARRRSAWAGALALLIAGLAVARFAGPGAGYLCEAAIGVARLVQLRKRAGNRAAPWLAGAGILAVCVGRLRSASWHAALWPDSSANALGGGMELLSLGAIVAGGAGWWLAEREWSRPRVSLRTAAILSAPGVLCYVALMVGERHLRARVAGDLQRRMERVAVQIAPADRQALFERAAAVDPAVSQRVWTVLRQLELEDERGTSTYLMALRDGTWTFPLTAKPTWDAAWEDRETRYRRMWEQDAWTLPGERPSFLSPFRDTYGMLVTATVPLIDAREKGRLLLCVDYPALRWVGELLMVRLPSLVLIGVAALCGGWWLAAQRRRAEADAAAALVAAVSHELRTPLQGISGYAELLGNAPLSGQQREWLHRLGSESRQLARLIRQMLDYSQLKKGGTADTFEHVSPLELAREAVVALEPAARAKGIFLNLSGDPALPAGVWTDAGRLRQILDNLLSNAVRYTASGGVTVRLSFEQPARLRGEVEDTGMGMSGEEQERLFEPFARGEQAMRCERDGLGLGLAIVREAIARSGGELSVTSEVGRGTTFRFAVPATATAVVAVGAGKPRCRLGGRDVLIVEDHPWLAALFVEWIGLLDGRGHVARSRREAEDWLATHGVPPVLLVDLVLPDGDGLGLAGFAKRTRDGGPVWRVAMSADNRSEIRRRVTQADWDGFLAKPFLLEDLAAGLAGCPWLEKTGDTLPLVTLSPERLRALRALFEGEVEAMLADVPSRLLAAKDFEWWTSRLHRLRNSAEFLGDEFRELSAKLAELEEKGRRRELASRDLADLRRALASLGILKADTVTLVDEAAR
jgi:signal transduction histidine kinase/CheY-like chemotaxis protein